MIWRYINTGENTGSFNMDFDMNLVNETDPGTVVLRLYRWKPYCISLGANQNAAEVDTEKAEADGIDIVKRPTGGRAIFHSEELTYSVIMPLTGEFSPKQIYQQINNALIKGLIIYDPGLTGLELEGIQPDMLSFYKENLGAACFGVPARSEIKYSGKKIVGSAQRKIGSMLLQHGSIMCGSLHTDLADYLYLDKDQIKLIKEELRNKTTEIESILHCKTDYLLLEESIVAGFEKYFEVNMFREELFIK